MKIRQARMSDLPAIVGIELENFSPEEAMSEEVLAAHIRICRTSFLVAEKEDQLLGYLEGPVLPDRHLRDQSFTSEVEDRSSEPQGYISITSLSISPATQGLGLGSQLLEAMKEVARRDGRLGINLTCHDYLLTYYEKQGFRNEGLSQSTYAGEVWYDMVWENQADQ